jgi:hypothetical protein
MQPKSSTQRHARISLTPAKRNEIAAGQGWLCKLNLERCIRTLPAVFHIDHKIPLREGGTNDISNLCATCPNCHQLKSWDETARYWDRQRERRTRRSKYWDPTSKHYYLKPIPVPPELERFMFRYSGAKSRAGQKRKPSPELESEEGTPTDLEATAPSSGALKAAFRPECRSRSAPR